MDTSQHNLSTLFRQLGLDHSAESIEQFIASHRPLDGSIELADAPWWNEGQVSFLREEIAEDADWAEQVDLLDAMLRHEG